MSYTTLRNPHFFHLDSELEARIISDKEKGFLHPHRCQDNQIIRRFNNDHDKASLLRPAFSRDCEKIINLPAYNRYTDKTQVFSFAQNDDISRRSLHVQLVARISRNIGRILGLNLDLIEAIALGHDIGHTPFGHAGEKFLKEIHFQHTQEYFNHNVHGVRVLNTLNQRNISLQTLNGVLCHNGEFAQQKLALSPMESFEDLSRTYQNCLEDQSHIASLRPSTLEGSLVRVCDMIAYLGKDRQDALEMGLLENDDCFTSDYLGITNGEIINNMTTDIVTESYGKPYIAMSEQAFNDIRHAKKQNYQFIYNNEGVIEGAGNIIQSMFCDMYEYFLEDICSSNTSSLIYTHHINKLLERSHQLTRKDYLSETPHQIVVDYLASMTDRYFISTYQRIFPGSFRGFPNNCN